MKVITVEYMEYCWLTFSEEVVQGGRLRGMPGGTRPHRWVSISTSIPREELMLERCFAPALGISACEEDMGHIRG